MGLTATSTTTTISAIALNIRYDDAILKITRERFMGIADLRSRGLVRNLGGLGVILSNYERQGDMTKADVSMDGLTKTQNDRVTFDQVSVPIPIFHKNFTLNERHLLASRTRGEALDTTQAEIATRIVAEKMEDALFNGLPGLVVDGKTVYGYTTHPDRNTGTLTSNWSTANGAGIIDDLLLMIQQAYDELMYGPFTLYIAKNIAAHLHEDYSADKGNNTIMQRIMAIPEISDVKVSPNLADNSVVMVQMTSDVVDLAVAQDITNLQWSTDPMNTHFKVFTAAAPRIKSEKDGRSGVFHWSL